MAMPLSLVARCSSECRVIGPWDIWASQSLGCACRSASVISSHGFRRFSVYICTGRPVRVFGTRME